ncbi:hypothetical protein [Actinokineospora globicatena]|uniref:hypothetical protein n=1 Tax=Actinokineospora globicatena TaxID=103729 RepID=UPI002555FB0A|nr:hypothetical protein [Actinokineospora globicatena]
MTTPNPAPPTGDPATPPATDPAPAAPPVPAPPANPPAQPSTGQGEPLGLTQADLDRIITTRLGQQKTQYEQQQADFQAKLAQAFGLGPEEQDPAKALEAAQQQATAFQQQAQTAMVESLAMAAGIKPDKVPLFARLVDVPGALNGVNPADGTAVRTALQSAVTATAALTPEFKGAALPASSGGDRQSGGTPSIDEQIAAAQKAGDWKTVIALKRAKAAQQPR